MSSEEEESGLCGFLFKLGDRGPVKLWKKRWFRWRKGEAGVHYFRPASKQNERESLGYVDLNLVTDCHETPDNFGQRKDRGEFVFQVNTPTRIYYLRANSPDNMQYWVDGIMAAAAAQSGSGSADRSVSAAASASVGFAEQPHDSSSDNDLSGESITPPSSSAQEKDENNSLEKVDIQESNDGEKKTSRLAAQLQSHSPSSATEASSSSSSSASSASSPSSSVADDASSYEYGRLTVKVVALEGLTRSVLVGCTGVYAMVSFEKQEVKTETTRASSRVQWNELFSFDVFNLQSAVNVDLWARDQSRSGGHLLGKASMKVADVKALAAEHGHSMAQEQTFALRESEGAELTLRLEYNATTKTVGVDDFELLKVVGRGNFGKVMQVMKKDSGRIYAMKVLRKDTIIEADAIRHTLAESAVLRRISHPFIVNLKYAFQTSDKLYMILDYLNGGELFFHLSNVDRFDEERARFYAAEIILALGFLHRNNVVYRDLKPENLLLDMSGHCCLTDFGLVKEDLRHDDRTYTFCGSPEYLAPEILLGKGYGKEVDWWALGTFLYEMLEGLPPYYDDDIRTMNDRILHAPLQFYDEHFSPDAQDLLRGLLQRDPRKRLGYGPADADHIMRHPFFKSINWDDLYNRRCTPSFRPHLASATDTRYFDPQFTSQTPKDSYVESHLSELQQRQFNGFTFMATASDVGGVSSSAEWRQKARRTKSLRRRNTDRISASTGAPVSALAQRQQQQQQQQPTAFSANDSERILNKHFPDLNSK